MIRCLSKPCTALLCDETQDMTECQISFLASFARSMNIPVFFVGDAVQTIYSFRGAKSKFIRELDTYANGVPVKDYKLTKSFRFGPRIAAVANAILFAKEHSPQTSEYILPSFLPSVLSLHPCSLLFFFSDSALHVPQNPNPGEQGHCNGSAAKSLWKTYRVVGRARHGGKCKVTTESLVQMLKKRLQHRSRDENANAEGTVKGEEKGVENRERKGKRKRQRQERKSTGSDYNNGPIVAIARKNVALLYAYLEVKRKIKADDDHSFPRTALNGRGDGSGAGKWRHVIKEIKHFYELWFHTGRGSDKTGDSGIDGFIKAIAPVTTHTLPFSQWTDDNTGTPLQVTWKSVGRDIEEREINEYRPHYTLVEELKDRTMQALEQFQDEVIGAEIKHEDADLILSTVHAAKGMEWWTVCVLGDGLLDLTKVKTEAASGHSSGFQSAASAATSKPPKHAFFDFKNYGDDVNLWYVAVTRAKKLLVVPSKFEHFMRTMRQLAEWKSASEDSGGCAGDRSGSGSAGGSSSRVPRGHELKQEDIDMSVRECSHRIQKGKSSQEKEEEIKKMEQ